MTEKKHEHDARESHEKESYAGHEHAHEHASKTRKEPHAERKTHDHEKENVRNDASREGTPTHERVEKKHADAGKQAEKREEKKEEKRAEKRRASPTATPTADPSLPWKIVSSILALLLIASILTGGFSTLVNPSPSGGSVGEQELDGAYVLGNPNAPVTIIEYSDFQCPYCGRFARETYQQLKKDYVDTGKVRIIFKHFPLGFHKNAVNAALAAECAGEQGKFYPYHDVLFENQQEWSELANPRDVFIGYAKQLGLDEAQFAACYDTQKYKEKIQQQQAAGQAKGVSGTPTFFINGQRLVGAQPYSAFKALIDAALQGKQAPQQEEQKPEFKPVNMTIREDDIMLGRRDAPVTMIEYTDFQCPFCRRYHYTTWPTIKQYVENGTVRYVIRNFPLSFHSMANETAQALLCIAEQNETAYWDAMDIVFDRQQELAPQSTAQYTSSQLYNWLENLSGVNISRVKECVQAGTYADRVNSDYTEAVRKAVEFGNPRIGTPFFFIGNDQQGYILVVGAYPPQVFEQLISDYAEGKNPLDQQ